MTGIDWIATIAGIVVGVVFVVAGASKIAVGDQWTSGAVSLGVPRWVSSIVPWAELVVGAFLIVGAVFGTTGSPSSSWAAWTALVMLVAFTGVLVRAVATHDPTPCNCFGTRSQAPVGPRHLLRNVALIALTVLVLLGQR